MLSPATSTHAPLPSVRPHAGRVLLRQGTVDACFFGHQGSVDRPSVFGDRIKRLTTKSRERLSGHGDGCESFCPKEGPSKEKFCDWKYGSRNFLRKAAKGDGYDSSPEDLSPGASPRRKLAKKALNNKDKELIGLTLKFEKHSTEPEKVTCTLGEIERFQDGNGQGSKGMDEDTGALAFVLDKLEALRLHILAFEHWNSSQLNKVHRKYKASAHNLLHYVALQSVDLREVQELLPMLGLAALEGSKSHILASLTRVIDTTRALLMVHSHPQAGIEGDMSAGGVKPLERSTMSGQGAANSILKNDAFPTPLTGKSKLELIHNTAALFGPRSRQRNTHIMVTMSEEMISKEDLVLELMKAGMDVVRINCAHGNTEAWGNIIQTVKHCSQMLEQPCRVLMDLAGPKLRTSAFPPGPCMLRIKPHRDGYGKVTLPARVWIALPGTPIPEGMTADAIVPVEGDIWLVSLQIGDEVKLHDVRGKERSLTITDKVMGTNGVGCWAECHQTTYLESGARLATSKKKGKHSKGYVAALPCLEHFIRLRKGDLLVLTKEASPQDPNALWINQVQVSHTFGQLFDCVKPGEVIRFDDGQIEGVISGVTSSKICVEVTLADEKGSKLGSEKSINLPGSNIRVKGLTVKDLVDLDFVVQHADMVGLSFVNGPEDVQTLQQALEKRGAKGLGVVLKIETRSGAKNLPDILLQGMTKENPLGVMIARGDLAVECGWENLAGLQEEILQVCKATHIPAIWATQVLEGLAKRGLPTRPEITDAAAAGRAACVMLNKGPHVVKTVSVLDSMFSQRSNGQIFW